MAALHQLWRAHELSGSGIRLQGKPVTTSYEVGPASPGQRFLSAPGQAQAVAVPFRIQ
jgi:hypothetical protein